MKRELHRRRIDVVRRLAQIEMIVGMNDVVLPARLAEDLERAVGHHFVGVHVGRSSGSALNHVDAEVVVVQPVSDLARRLRNRVDDLAIDEPQLEIGQRGCFFHGGERGDQSREFTKLDARDAEVLHRAQCLDSIESAGGYISLSEQVVLPTRRSRQIDTRSLRRFETQLSETGRAWGFHA